MARSRHGEPKRARLGQAPRTEALWRMGAPTSQTWLGRCPAFAVSWATLAPRGVYAMRMKKLWGPWRVVLVTLVLVFGVGLVFTPARSRAEDRAGWERWANRFTPV